MPTKLIKACKDLNVGMSTLVEHCKALGREIAFDPNARIDDETYLMLAREFSKVVYNQVIISKEEHCSTDLVQSETGHFRFKRICREFGLKSKDLSNLLKAHDINWEINENTSFTRDQYDLIRELYLNSPKGLALVKNTREEIDKETLKEIWKVHTEVQEQILKLRSTPIKIDPNSINVVGEKLYVQSVADSYIDDIIVKLSDILQYQISDLDLKNRYVLVQQDVFDTIDETEKTKLLELAATNQVGFSFRPIVDGYIKSRTTNTAKFNRLLQQLNIKPELDKQGRMLLSTSELEELSQKIVDNKDYDIPTQASAIINISPSPVFALKKIFPNIRFETDYHRETVCYGVDSSGAKLKSSKFVHSVFVNGGYFVEEIAQKLLDEFGMRLNRVDICFHLSQDAVNLIQEKKALDKKINKDNTIIYRRNIVYHKDPFDVQELENEIQIEDVGGEEQSFELNYERIKRNIYKISLDVSAWKSTLNHLVGENAYTLEVKYLYRFAKKSNTWLDDELKVEYESKLRSYLPSNLSLSKNLKSVGVDFDWTEEDLFHITHNLNRDYPDVRFDIYDNHRCKVDIKVSDIYIKETEELLTNKFEGVEFVSTNSKNEVYFFKECDSLEQEAVAREHIIKAVRALSNDKVDVEILTVPSGYVKLRIDDGEEKRKEEGIEAIRELRGAEFTIGDNRLGVLINVNDYPNLVFDISGESFDKTREILSNFSGGFLTPNLIGDQEKVARLKEALKKISSGKGVQNPNLNEFIFDATFLRPEKDFNEKLRLYLQEIEKNLLNGNINPSQKKAIAKTLVAKDLALIQGPPGTGKSTAIAEIIWQHIVTERKSKILLTSETNLAVDNAIAKMLNSHNNLVKPIRIGADDRLESEGKQFSLKVLQDWADEKVLDFIPGTENDDYDDDVELYEGETSFLDENVVFDSTAQNNDDLNALEKWLRNIVRRADASRMAPETLEKWQDVVIDPDIAIRKAMYSTYIKNCNVIGATCSSIGKENIMLSRLLTSKYGQESKALCSFYKTYQQIYGEPKLNPFLGKMGWSQPDIKFDVVIQDESSKATPAELSLPLIYGYKNIVIGDHRQLPPMLSKESFEQSFDFLLARATNDDDKLHLTELKRFVSRNFHKLEISQFERLFYDIPIEMKGVFNMQYRMHPAINAVIKQFYQHDGGLSCGLEDADNPNMHHPSSRYHGINIPGFIHPDDHVVWIDTNSPEMHDGTSRINYGEIDVIRKVLHRLNDSDSYQEYLSEWSEKEDKQIGLISFYGKQLRLLKGICTEIPNLPIRVSTVDRFQGMERNIIIVSLVRSNCIAFNKDEQPDYKKYPDFGYAPQDSLGFADSPNRLNVALSRAKRLLIIVGNSDHFRRHPIYNNVFHTILDERSGKVINASDL